MKFKRIIVRKLVDITHSWNTEIHHAIEEKVTSEYIKNFPHSEGDNLEEKNRRMHEMRHFYYSRMSVTATLLVAVAAIFATLVIFLIQLFPAGK